MRSSVVAVLTVAALASVSNVWRFASTLDKPSIYHKDFLNHYVLGRSALLGINPYQGIAELGRTFVGPQIGDVFPHPSPYPPPNVLLFAPFGALSYPDAVIAWHVLQAVSLVFVAFLLTRETTTRRTPFALLAISVLSLAWTAVADDFVWGNSMLVLLVPLTLSWMCFRRERDWRGGLWLGIVIALKFLAWPLLLLLALKRRWRAIAAAGAAIVIANVAGALIVGFAHAFYYYGSVPEIVVPLYRARIDNFSMYGMAWRFFEGTGTPIFDTLRAAPFVYAPAVAAAVSIPLPLLTIGAALYVASRTRSFDLQFALMLCACVITAPLAWQVYLVWLAIPLSVAVAQLKDQSPTGQWLAGVVAVLLFGYPIPLSILGVAVIRDDQPVAPFITSVLTFIPLFAVAGLFALLFRTRPDKDRLNEGPLPGASRFQVS